MLYVYSGKARSNGIGLDQVVRQQMKALCDAGHHVVFVARGRYSHPNVTNVSFPITPAHFLSALSSNYYYTAQHRFISQVGAWIARFGKFDIVIGWTRQSRNLFRSSNRTGAFSLLNCPGWHHNYPLGNDRWVLRPWPAFRPEDLDEEYDRADALFTASEFAKDTFLANGFPSSKVVNIGRAADPERYVNRPRPAAPFRLAFFAQISERKGFFQAIEAWKRAAIADGELWIIGNAPKDMIDRIKSVLPDNATMFGFVKDAERLLSQCHVQILPSRQEGMAKSLVEGAACGLVTLATRETGFPIIDGVTGYYVDREDIDGMARHLRELANDSELLSRMSLQSAEFVNDNLTWSMFHKRFIKAIETHVHK